MAAIIKKILKILLWFFAGVFALLIVVAIALQVPAVQQMIADKAVTFLREKLDTTVELESINITFPKSISINGFYLTDRNNDTLWYNKSLEIDLNMFALIGNKVQINRLELEGGTIHLHRSMPDSTFNFDFITEAFAGDTDTTKQDTTASDVIFDVDKIRFKDIYFTFNDEVSGTELAFNIGRFNIDADEIDPAESVYTVDRIRVQNTTIDVLTYKESPQEEQTGPIDVNFGFNVIDITNLNFNFENRINNNIISAVIGKSEINVDEVDLPAQIINLRSAELHNSHASFVINKVVTADTVAQKVTDPVKTDADDVNEAGWFIKVKRLNFNDNKFTFLNHNDPPQQEGINYSDLEATEIQLAVNDLYYSSQRITARINQFSLMEKSGFHLKQFETDLVYDSTKTELANLYVKTNHSEIKDYLLLEYESLEQFSSSLGRTGIRVNLNGTNIAYRDVLYFTPDLSNQPPFMGNRDESLRLDTEITGTIDNLDIESLSMSTLNNTSLNMRGNIKGLPDANSANYNLVIRDFTTTQTDIYSLTPPATIPENISIPPQINLTGFFYGNLNNFRTNLNLNSSYGSIVAQANVTGGAEQNFDIEAAIKQFNLGQLLRQDTTMGVLDMELKAEGTGLDPEKMNATYEGVVNVFEFNNYNYENLNFTGEIADQMVATSASLDDNNLIFTLNAEVSLDTANPRYFVDLRLAGADLQALNIMEDDLRLSFRFRADLDGYDLNNLNGDISLHNVLIVKDDEQYNIDSLLYASISEDRNNSIQIDSDFLSGKFEGTMGIFDLPKALERHFSNYFPIDVEPVEEPLAVQNFKFDLTIHNPEILSDVIVPELESLKPGNISGEFNSEADELNLQISIPKIVYSGINIDTLIIDISSDDQNFYVNTHMAKVTNETLNLENPTLILTASNDTMSAIFQMVDEESKEEKYLVSGNIYEVNDIMRLSLYPSGVKLFYENWTVADDNYISFGDNLYFHNLHLSREDQFLEINNTGSEYTSPIEFRLNDFHLPYLTRIINDEYAIVGGIINGNIIIRNINEEAPVAFTADLEVENFSYKGDTVGTLNLTANNTTANRYAATMDIEGYGNKLNANGYYQTMDNRSSLDFDLNIENLNLSTIESFTMGHLRNMSGGMEGELKISGTTEEPDLTGYLQFKNSSFILNYINSSFTLADERIIFTTQGINFNNLTIRDSLNNQANIRGFLYTNHFKDFRFAMDVSTRDFLALNTKEKDDELFYGTVFLDSDISIRGDVNQPVVNMTARLKEDSEFTVVLPKDEIAIVERKGIIEFVDYTGKYSKIMTRTEVEDDTVRSELTGINLNANIEINRSSKLKIVVDETAGDSLVLFGDATLSFGIDPSGKMSLTGRYEIAEGTYQMTFYVRRRFNIQSGSSITWTGNPLSANVDITAVYNVRTAPIDLMASQIAGTEELQQNRYRQKLPFQVFLNMDGDLMSPDISFDIELAPEERGGDIGTTVVTKLDQLSTNESELNKQVFALLVLERFLPEDPLEITSGGGGGAEGIARESVSRILGQQLNRIAGRHIKGFELNVGLESYQDYSTGQAEGRTELEVGLSKQFLNDRVTVNVGTNFDLEGERARRSNLNSIAGDVSIEYKLTEDGRFRMRAFRESIFEGIIEGEIIETGMGLIYTKDYNHIRELFRREPEDDSFRRRDE